MKMRVEDAPGLPDAEEQKESCDGGDRGDDVDEPGTVEGGDKELHRGEEGSSEEERRPDLEHATETGEGRDEPEWDENAEGCEEDADGARKLQGIETCDAVESDDGGAEAAKRDGRGICEESEGGGLEGAEADADEKGSADGERSAEAGCALKEGTEGEGDKEELKAGVLRDTGKALLEESEASGAGGELVHEDYGQDNPEDREETVSEAVHRCEGGERDRHAEETNRNEKGGGERDDGGEVRLEPQAEHEGEQKEKRECGDNGGEPPPSHGIVSLRPGVAGARGGDVALHGDEGKRHMIGAASFGCTWFETCEAWLDTVSVRSSYRRLLDDLGDQNGGLNPSRSRRKRDVKQVQFAFGKGGITVSLSDGPEYMTVESRSAKPLEDCAAALEYALDHPIGSVPLRELAAGKKTAAISVCDITRPAPNSTTLPPLLRRLHEAGIAVDGITILIATGLHRAASEAEIQAIVGAEIAAKYRVVNHDAKRLAEHRWLGTTGRGTPVYLDERFLRADLHITLGFIEQHLMLGFSGGRKLVAPGLAAQETIKVIHSPRFMREPMATEGSTTDNPLHAELLEIAAMARHDFMLDVTLTQTRAISGIFAGSPVEAHAEGVRFLRETSLEQLPGLADVVITSAAGYPLDLTFYQTVKGITAAQHIVKPGGRILILGECSEGAGSPEFSRKLEAYAGHQQYLDEIRQSEVEVDQWQLEKLALAGLQAELFFYTPGVTERQIGALGRRFYTDLPAAIAAVMDGVAPGACVALVPEGPYVYARAR